MSVDLGTLAASVGTSLLGGGIVGGLVSLAVSKRESRDRGEALALEREKWEHERDTPIRERQREALHAASDALRNLMQFRIENRTVDGLIDSLECLNDVARSIIRLTNNGLTDATVPIQAALGSFFDSYKPENDPVNIEWLIEAEAVGNFLDGRAAEIV